MREATSKAENPGFTLRKRRSKRHPPIKFSDLDFADDIAYSQPISEIKSVNGEKIKNVEDFKYLGSWIDNTQKDIKVRSTGLGSLQQALQNMEI